MSVRIQVVLDARERELFRARAKAEGRSLSQWLRDAGRARIRATEGSVLRTPEDLKDFFADCDAREQGQEPSWDEHAAVIAASRIDHLPTA
ncbi:MAG TPA: hypothetical protein VFD41_15325 [Actinomycetales bacterium]|nr:hypothetical protein [Actinomycetales bacterium]